MHISIIESVSHVNWSGWIKLRIIIYIVLFQRLLFYDLIPSGNDVLQYTN